jgi:LPS export ABC transporter permease LptG/LPS export ABC transporter permease LptF
MLRTIDRYVIRETIPPFLLSLLIFTFILEIPPIMRDLEQLVAKGVTWTVAGQILLTLIPQGLGLTIPMALLTGLLIGLGRLSADREAVALLACGVSPYRLLRPVLLMSVVAAGATLYVMLEAIPNANQRFREITFELISKQFENDVRPRVFFEDFPQWVLYARDEPESGGGWKDVLVADNRTANATGLYLARTGRVVLDREARTVDLVLSDGTRYTANDAGETDIYRFQDQPLILSLDPDSVFPRAELPRGLTEKTVAELQKDAAVKLAGKPVPLSPHPEIHAMHVKFSVPVACLVFGVIGLALGLTVAREGKLAGFVIGVAVIFAYYSVMFLAESHSKGHFREIEDARGLLTATFTIAHLARWWPNIVLGLFGIAALIWRARYSEGKLPIRIPIGLPHLPSSWHRSPAPPTAAGGVAPGARKQIVLVVKFPRIRMPGPSILDRYISRLYMRIIGLSFMALLGIFYIATFLDKTDKLFKGEASTGMVVQLLAYMTPQFVYYVIPIGALLSVLVTFGLLSKSSELTVMKACGISLYRAALPLIALSLVWTLVLFGLEQEIMARANRQAEILDARIRNLPTKTFNPLNRRWVVGRDGSIYHYKYFDSEQRVMHSLSIYSTAEDAWRLTRQTFATRVQFRGEWRGFNGWTQEFLPTSAGAWQPFAERSIAMEPPEYFESEQPIADLMTVAQLREHIEELRHSGFNVIPATVELQRKVAFPFVTLVMTLVALPFGITMGRRGTLYGIGLAIVLALGYWLLFSVFLAIGRTGLLSPALAAWTPNIIVVGCAIYLLLTART